MLGKYKQTGLAYLWLTVIFLVIDQITKQYFENTLDLYQSINVLPFFDFTLAHNYGAAFSFLADQPGWQRWFFTAIAVIASIVFIVWMAKTPKDNKVLGVGFALMLSGALGNLIDRLIFGYVIDFLDFYVSGYHWPAFNIADSAIFVGAALMIYDSFTEESDEKKEETAK